MTPSVEQNILDELKVLRAMIAGNYALGKGDAWVPIETIMSLSGLSRQTIHCYVSHGRIIKRGHLYSYKSYLEYCGVCRKKEETNETI